MFNYFYYYSGNIKTEGSLNCQANRHLQYFYRIFSEITEQRVMQLECT